MKRRSVLALAGTAVGLAGCSGAPRTPTDAPPASPAPIESYGCPPAAPERTGIVCSHTVDTASASLYLLPSELTARGPDSLDLTLHNDSATDLTFNPYSWTVRRELVGGWERLDRRSQGDGRLVLEGDETHTWTFTDVIEAVDPEVTPGRGTYTAAISVPDSDGSDWLVCVALFRLS